MRLGQNVSHVMARTIASKKCGIVFLVCYIIYDTLATIIMVIMSINLIHVRFFFCYMESVCLFPPLNVETLTCLLKHDAVDRTVNVLHTFHVCHVKPDLRTKIVGTLMTIPASILVI